MDTTFRFLILILIFAIILALIWGYISREKFQEVATKIIFTTQPLVDKYWAGPPTDIFKYVESPKEYLGLLDLKESEIDPAVFGTENVELYIVADGYNASARDFDKPVAESPAAYFVRLGLPGVITQLDCTYSLLNKRVGYLDQTDLGFIRGLMSAYRTNTADLVQVPVEAIKDLRTYLRKAQIDVIITHVIPYSDMHLELLDQPIVLDGFTGIDPERMRIMYPWAKTVPLDVDQWRLPGSVLLVNRTDKAPIYRFNLGLYSIRANIKPAAAAADNFTGAPEVVKKYREDPVAADLSYKCYGSPQTTRKIACESPYDMLGEPKFLHTEWDQPCKENEDCPFYNGSRGGCGPGGICELPLGVRRLGFRKYNDRGLYAPYCYAPGGHCNGGNDYAFKDDGRQTDPDHYEVLY